MSTKTIRPTDVTDADFRAWMHLPVMGPDAVGRAARRLALDVASSIAGYIDPDGYAMESELPQEWRNALSELTERARVLLVAKYGDITTPEPEAETLLGEPMRFGSAATKLGYRGETVTGQLARVRAPSGFVWAVVRMRSTEREWYKIGEDFNAGTEAEAVDVMRRRAAETEAWNARAKEAAAPVQTTRCRRCGETWAGRFGNGGPADLCDDCQED